MLLAQSGAGVGFDASLLYQYGGLLFLSVCALGAVRVLYTQFAKALDLERDRNATLTAELRKLNQDVVDKYVPALERATATMERALKLLARRDDG